VYNAGGLHATSGIVGSIWPQCWAGPQDIQICCPEYQACPQGFLLLSAGVSCLTEVVNSAEAANTKAFEAVTALQAEVESGEQPCEQG